MSEAMKYLVEILAISDNASHAEWKAKTHQNAGFALMEVESDKLRELAFFAEKRRVDYIKRVKKLTGEVIREMLNLWD